MKLKFIALTLLVYTTALVTSCTEKKSEATQNEGTMEHTSTDKMPDEVAPPAFVVDAQFQKQLSETFAAYVKLKDAFVASDGELVDSEAFKTQNKLTRMDSKLLTGAALNDWTIYQQGMDGALKGMQSTDDLEKKRAAFTAVTENLYKSIKAYGLGGLTAYYEFCPMAFDNQGAYWLSDNDAIRNPYFGDRMLKCGSVEEKLQ
jgi:hypothetical protein